MLQWARAHGCPWDSHVFSAAVRNGNLSMVEWMMAEGAPWSPEAPNYAAVAGHLHIFEWMLAIDNLHWSFTGVCESAAIGGHLDVLQLGRARTVSTGTAVYVVVLQPVGALTLFSGRELMAAPGIRLPVLGQPRLVISRCLNGHEVTTSPEMLVPAPKMLH